MITGSASDVDYTDTLRHAIEVNASDVHVQVGSSPRVRVNSELRPTPFPVAQADHIDQFLRRVMPPERYDEYTTTGDADFSLAVDGLGRFRGNAFRQRGGPAFVLRRVLPSAVSAQQLGLPDVVTRLANEQRGMVLVTGPTGSGKTTTLAAMVDHINQSRSARIITIEDPIEVIHLDKRSVVAQREIGTDTTNYAQAMRRALRQDPDVILIGEMRDAETVETALGAAETGHLVLSTLHTTNAVETINRIVSFFPPHQHGQIRLTLAAVLRGVVSQRLVQTVSGRDRVAAIEAMVVDGRIVQRIIDPTSGDESIEEIVATGGYSGSQSFDQALVELFKAGTISLDAALAASSNPHDVQVKLKSAGLV